MRRLILSALAFLCFCLKSLAATGVFYPSESFSNSIVTSICQDKSGCIWIATDYGLNRFDGYHFTSIFHDENDSLSICDSEVTCLYCDRDKRLWVGTKRGLDRYDPDARLFVHYRFPLNPQPHVSSITQLKDGTMLVGTAGYGMFMLGQDGSLKETTKYEYDENNKFFSRIFVDSEGNVWTHGFNKAVTMTNGRVRLFRSSVGDPVDFVEWQGKMYFVGQYGLMVYSGGNLVNAQIDLSELSSHEAIIRSVCVSQEGDLIIGTRGDGLFLVRKGTNKLERYDISARGVDVPTSKVRALYGDKDGNLWMGLERKGIFLIPKRSLLFNSWTFDTENIRVSSSISSICDGDDGMMWTVVQNVGIYGFNNEGHVVAHPKAPELPASIYRDKNGDYWVGTHNSLYRYNPLTGASSKAFSFDCDYFNDITSVGGLLYVSAFSRGFCIFNPHTGELRNHNMYEVDDAKRGRLCNNWIMAMMPDRKGRVWLATASGAACYDPKTDSFRTIGDNNILPGKMCFSLCEMKDGTILIGTDNGLYRFVSDKNQVERMPGSDELNNRIVSYIVQSSDGNIWCSTSQGIWQLDTKKQMMIGYEKGNGLITGEYLYGVGLHTDDDRVFFGTNHGLTMFHPSMAEASRVTPSDVNLVELTIGGQPVSSRTLSDGSPVFEGSFADARKFSVSYLDNTITFAFSLTKFEYPSNVSYEYRINDGEWERTAFGINDFTLRHLTPGDYTIDVRALTPGGYSTVQTYTLDVRSPWWKTVWAKIFYFLIFGGIAVYFIIGYRRRHEEQQNEEKMKFLINATHDIRSPLTLILSPLQKLKQQLVGTPALEENAEVKRSLETIEHNAERILNLVNQILDVRKIDKQQMHLHCRETDLVTFISGICKMYDYNAHERGITFKFNHDDPELKCWIDRSQFDKVVSNLLSNAFKYTLDGGTIEVCLRSDNGRAVIEVVDSGAGIDERALKHIFDRFYQAHGSQQTNNTGSGIGLNLCKMIVDMHHGDIIAANRTDSHGSRFTVVLPLGKNHLRSEEIDTETSSSTTAAVKSSAYSVKGGQRGQSVLIVDDDMEISRYIMSELGKYYKFGIACNGKEGMNELLNHDYDLVISDVMMPEMDGFTMLRMIKTNLNISHIPVIMLTSKADVGNRLEGLERGADAFLAKPFDMDELHLTIDNLISGRQRLKGKFSGAQQQADRVEQMELKGNDEQLMERIMKAVNKNLSDSDFNVDMLTQEVGISRAQLHRKMKEMTGISTSEFIRNIRLEQAARLLKEQKVNITQVAYATGFSNLAHFSTVFRKHFGCSPSEFAEREDA